MQVKPMKFVSAPDTMKGKHATVGNQRENESEREKTDGL